MPDKAHSLLSSARRRRFLARSLSLCAIAAPGPAAWAQTAAKPLIRFGYVDGWADSVATTHLAAAIVRGKLGHPVELVSLAAGLMWQGVARGDRSASDCCRYGG